MSWEPGHCLPPIVCNANYPKDGAYNTAAIVIDADTRQESDRGITPCVPAEEWTARSIHHEDSEVREMVRGGDHSKHEDSGNKQRINLLASRVPEELFERILRHTTLFDGYILRYSKKELGQCALVCKYWAQKCQASIFAWVKLRNAGDVRGLLAILDRPGTSVAHYVKKLVIEDQFIDKPLTPTPWLHLVSLLQPKLPFCRVSRLMLWGPLPEGTRTLRTIHFSLPRTVPTYNTRLHSLHLLTAINLICFSDLVHFLDELRDLRKLRCWQVTWSRGPSLTRLRSIRLRSAYLEQVKLEDCPMDEYTLWLLSVYRAPPGTQSLYGGKDFFIGLRAFLITTIVFDIHTYFIQFRVERYCKETSECRLRRALGGS